MTDGDNDGGTSLSEAEEPALGNAGKHSPERGNRLCEKSQGQKNLF